MRIEYWWVFLLLFFSCSEPQQKINKVQKVDVNSSDKVKLSELFSNCDIVPLETTDSSLIGLVIDRVECYKDRIYVLNQLQSHKNILCFDSLGHFLFSIDRIGRAPDEYTFLGDFFIDLNKEQLVLVSEAGRFIYFSMDGRYLYDKKTNDSYLPVQVVFNDSNYLIYNDIEENIKNCDLLVLDTSTMNISRNLENPGEITYNTGARALSVFQGHVLYYHFNDTLYLISSSGERKAAYYLDCGKSHSESRELVCRKAKTMRGDGLVKFVYSLFNQGKLKYISSVLEDEKWIIINGKEHDENKPFRSFFVLYDKVSGKSYNSSNINWEFLEPLNTDLQIVSCYGGTLFCLVNKEFSQAEKEKLNNCDYLTSDNKELLKQRQEGDNPFLLQLK